MRAKIYDQHGIQIFQEDSRFFVRYDAGAHMIVPRLDEISQEEADLAMTGPTAAEQVLLSLRKRLQAAGVDSYRTNV
jgi:hypothetical protein